MRRHRRRRQEISGRLPRDADGSTYGTLLLSQHAAIATVQWGGAHVHPLFTLLRELCTGVIAAVDFCQCVASSCCVCRETGDYFPRVNAQQTGRALCCTIVPSIQSKLRTYVISVHQLIDSSKCVPALLTFPRYKAWRQRWCKHINKCNVNNITRPKRECESYTRTRMHV